MQPLGSIPPEGKYIFQAPVPGPLSEDQARAAKSRPLTRAFDFRNVPGMKPQIVGSGGEVRVVDSRNFPAAVDIAMAHVTVKKGGLREMHWHPNADEWQY